MTSVILIALRTAAVTLALTCGVYPLVVTVFAQVLFPDASNGSLVRNERGEPVGSSLIGQSFSSPSYFHSRPSAAGAGYDGTSSGGSNLGPTSRKLRDRVIAQTHQLRQENSDADGPVPAELVTTSGSGLDPHLSPEAAHWQVARIAKSRGVGQARVHSVVDANLEGRTGGILGEPRVNVLLLNLALDRQFGAPAKPLGGPP